MTIRATLAAALLATIRQPATWVLGLGGFLIRGGTFLALLPIVTLPTPARLGDTFGPVIVSVVFEGVSTELVAIVALAGLIALLVIVGGGFVAAVLEAAAIRIVAGTTGSAAADPGSARKPARRVALTVLAVRLVSILPLMAVVTWGTSRVVAATYAELTLPGDAGTPLPLRVLAGVPEVVVAFALTWALTELIGGIAARRVVLDGRSAAGALGGAIASVVRHPIRSALGFLLPTVVLAAVAVVAAVAASAAWTAARAALIDGQPAPLAALAVSGFAGLWLGGLAVIGVICAWRGAIWTVDRLADEHGTFGGSSVVRPGDWSPGASSGNL